MSGTANTSTIRIYIRYRTEFKLLRHKKNDHQLDIQIKKPKANPKPPPHFKCQYCDYETGHKQSFKYHENIHLVKMGIVEESRSTCEICGKSFANEATRQVSTEMVFLLRENRELYL